MKTLTSAWTTALAESVIRPCLLVTIDINGTVTRYTTALNDLTWNSNTYTSGVILSTSDITSAQAFSPQSFSMDMELSNSTISTIATGTSFKRVVIDVDLMLLNEDWSPVDASNSVSLFKGVLDGVKTEYNGGGHIAILNFTNSLESLGNFKGKNLLYDIRTQQLYRGFTDDYSLRLTYYE